MSGRKWRRPAGKGSPSRGAAAMDGDARGAAARAIAAAAGGNAAAGGMDRREFLKAALKLGALGALAYLGLRAAKGAVSGAPLSETCVLGSPLCSSCAQAAGCGHPTALSYKSAMGGLK